MKKPISICLLLIAVLFTNLMAHAQGAYTGTCLSGNCKNGEGSYRIASFATYTGGFKNGMPSGNGRIDGPGWYISGTFNNDMIENYQEHNTAANAHHNGLIRSGNMKYVTYDIQYVRDHAMTENFYEMNGRFFKYLISGTCTVYRDKDWTITGQFTTDNPYILTGKAVVNYQGTDYQFNFPGKGEWVLVVSIDKILSCLKANNFATGLLYDYSNCNTTPTTTSSTTTTATKTSSGEDETFNKLVKDMEEKKAADKVSKEQSLKTAIQEDFCAAIQRVVKDYPNNFENLKAEEKKFFMTHTFTTKYSVKGALETEIQKDMMMDLNAHKYYNTWHCSLFKGPSTFMNIVSLYKDYVNKINACTQTCCTFVSTTESADNLGDRGQKTIWTVKSVNSGNSQEYTYLKIHIEFTLNSSTDIWTLQIWIG